MSSLRMRPGVDTIAEIEARLWSPALRKAASPGEKEEGAPGAIFLGEGEKKLQYKALLNLD